MTGSSIPTDRPIPRSAPAKRTAHRIFDDASSSDEDPHARARSGLVPGSAVANYFNLDFSFLDDEPPPRATSAYGALRRSSVDLRRKPAGREEDYFSLSRMSDALPSSKRDSVSSSVSLRQSGSSLPFPSRPKNPRRISTESAMTLRSSVHSPGEHSDYLSSHLRSSIDGRRPSMASILSGNSYTSGGSSYGYGSRLSPVSPTFPPIAEAGSDTAEKRKRLAAFLDETASAMEGGKSLAMVLPESRPTAPQPKTLSELAEECASPGRSSSRSSERVEYRHPFDGRPASAAPAFEVSQSPTSPDTANFPDSASSPEQPPRADSAQDRHTVYFTPKAGQSSDEHEAGETTASKQDPSLDVPTATGLDLGSVELRTPSTRSISEHSPSTVRAGSPAFVPAPEPAEQTALAAERSVETERKLRNFEKRRRIIQELVETEMTYAVDMAVVRDIYFARARGAHMAQIADHVMSTGLGLAKAPAASPPSPSLAPRRASHRPDVNRRVSSAPSVTGRNELRRTTVAAMPNLMPGQPLMSPKDLHIVFANLEEIAALAEGFANLLDSASGGDDPDAMDDRIGEVFVEMIPRIQQVYSTYCVRHHRAIIRLQELEPTLRTYLSECKTLSHGRTNAWDLASLLIKPVQRCLKYPLLLDQILALTPDDHPDRVSLQRANTDVLMVAEHINEYKKRNDAVARVVAKDKSSQRRESTRSISSTVTKKLLRSSQKAKTALGFAENGGDEMFDTLVALVDSTRSGALRFSNEMRDWTKSTKTALEAQVGMVEGWINMYAPMAGERHTPASISHRRLCIFLDEVLIPIIEGPWRELDYEVRHSLILKTDHLLSLFENPRQVIAKRNDKMLDHSRYLAKKLPADRRGSEEFLLLSSQLLEELPRFLGSVSRYFNIIVGHFAGAQAAYHETVQERWSAFAEQWLVQVPDGSYEGIEAAFDAAHQPLAQMMETLAAGLGISAAQSIASSPAGHQRFSRISQASGPSSLPTPSRPYPSQPTTPDEPRHSKRRSYLSSTTEYSSEHVSRGSLGSTYRSSVTSNSSAPSLRPSSADGSGSSKTTEPVTPPPLPSRYVVVKNTEGHLSKVIHEPLNGHDRHSMALRYDAPLPPAPSAQPTSSLSHKYDSPAQSNDSSVARPRETTGRTAQELRERYLSTYSVYVPADEGGDEDDFGADGPLYVAEAVNACRSSGYRSGYPIWSLEVGDRLMIELEEADSAEGGAGWLLCRKDGVGKLGWARTEDLVMIETIEEEEGSSSSQSG
ncbi:rho guanyl-nucleotide exchange factor [Rhodotorula toruloides]|uniref:Rho guanyl-nucleotide exchange factor n=1 Tax=Rhodotorula toruloides TaxID=5286 RepID=A0A511K7Q5_RHOTO|nr:rho guanyl-nucleotide exchange factor [Rhodotorula toruloides]